MATSAVPAFSCVVDKAELSKTLRLLQAFDPQGCPYIGIELIPDGKPRFFRSSFHGFIHSQEYCGTETYVSLAHLQECLKAVDDDTVELKVVDNVLRVYSTTSMFANMLPVHTVGGRQAGLKSHAPGDRKFNIDRTGFSGFDTKPLHCSALPILISGNILFPTQHAAVLWHGPESIAHVQLSPREPMLRLISGDSTAEDLHVTENGYWGATFQGMFVCISGHKVKQYYDMYEHYTTPSTEIAKFPADRLLKALRGAATYVSGDEDKLEFNPKQGVVARNKWGSAATFSLGDTGDWAKFGVKGKAAKIIVDALSQAQDDHAVLQTMPLNNFTYLKFVRGPFEVIFKVV